jgi:hypothetical protein
MRSTIGYIFLLAGGAISRKSVKWTLIASFTIEAEFVACYEASNQVIWLQNFITRLCVVDGIEKPLKLFYINKVVVYYSNNNRSLTKSKSIDLKFLVMKERVHNGIVSIKLIGTGSILPDLLTKVPMPKAFIEHITSMDIVSIEGV